ncbi:MAG: ABC transporter permease [Thermoleophilia bacterium]|nr:ABC transporter permease [Thermoleophilia bacterium]
MILNFRKPMAFLKKDFLMEISYKFSFVLQFASIFFSVVMFYFVAKLLGDAPSVQSSLSEYGGDYFSFVLIGIAFSNFLSVGLGSFATSIRSEQMIGTLEAMLVTPTRLSNIVLSSSQWSFAFTSLRVGVYLLIGGLFFGVSFAGAAVLPALLALVLTVVAFSSLGIISASFIMVYKRGDPIAFVLATSSTLLGGVYYPISVLPGWLQSLSYLFPITYSLRAIRLSLLQGAGFDEVGSDLLALLAFSCITIPISLFCFRLAVRRAKRDGSLAHY